MSELYRVPRVWVNQPCFIIGGGPSLLHTPGIAGTWDINKRIIVINNAFELFPFADVLYFGDIEWADDNAAAVVREWHGSQIITRVCPREHWGFKAKRVARNMSVGLSRDAGSIAGWCSGSNAINLAYLFGCNPIVLIGFDMKGDNWHTKHQRPKKEDCYNRDFIPSMNRMAIDILEETDCKVYNATPDSALECFEYKPLTDFFK